MKRTITIMVAVMVFILAFAAPAFASTLVHVGVLKGSGDLWINKQVGHFCNTGAEQTQTIRGVGELTKDFNIAMVKGKTTVVDKNDFVSAVGTANPLVITSEIRLCTPPKYTYKGLYGDEANLVAPVGLGAIYPVGDAYTMPAYWDGTEFVGTTVGWLAKAGGWTALTSQTWASRVKADPGFSGKLNQNWAAAYGGYAGRVIRQTDPEWESSTASGGAKYIGDYFTISQTAHSSQGKVDRYIDISSPWSHAYLYEDFEAVGFAEITERFNLSNRGAASTLSPKWWQSLFVKR